MTNEDRSHKRALTADELRSKLRFGEPMHYALHLVWMAPIAFLFVFFGVYSFVVTTLAGYEYQRRMELINAGTATQKTLYVTSLCESVSEESTRWTVYLSERYPSDSASDTYRSVSAPAGLAVGTPLTAYKFGNEYLIPDFDHGNHFRDRWAVLGLGVLIPAAAMSIFMIVGRHRRSQWQADRSAGLIPPDPEKFVIGKGGSEYNHIRSRWNDEVYRIEPIPFSIVGLIGFNLVLCAACYGLHYLLKTVDRSDLSPWVVYGLPIGGGLATGIVTSALVYHVTVSEQRKGPYLIYHAWRGRMELPRLGKTFDRDEIVHLQYITTKNPEFGFGKQFSELNLVTEQDGIRHRWPILKSDAALWPFDRMLEPLVDHTDLSIVRVHDHRRRWKVTETDYRQS